MSIEFTVSTERKSEHLLSIVMKFTAPSDNPILELPSWTPGSYLIREYSRHIQDFSVSCNKMSVPWKKITKNNWQIFAKEGDEVNVSYNVYCFEMTVRTNYLDNYIGLINGTATFFYPCRSNPKTPIKNTPIKVKINSLDFEIFTSMKSKDEYFEVDNFDELYDSPIGFAIRDYLDQKEYEIDGIPCTLAIIGKRGNHDINQLADDLQKIQHASIEMFGELPYDRYLWMLYLVDKGGGGLEHKFSNVSITSRWSFSDRKNYLNVLRLESHEHFHVYNVKRIRPQQLDSFDYEKEVYTTALWIAEGLTNYYEKKILLYAGLMTLEEYLDQVSMAINKYFDTPGRFVRSLAESSFDAWIKLYRPDENSINSNVSYYLKGGLVGLLLDIEILKKTNGIQKLDDFFRHLYKKYKENPSYCYDPDQFDKEIESFTGVSVSEFFKKYVYGVDELPFTKYLEEIGFSFIKEMVPAENLVGIKFKNNSNIIESIRSDSPASETGLCPNDEIIAVQGYKYEPERIKKIIEAYPEHFNLQITYFHDKIEMKTTIKNVKFVPKYRIEITPELNPTQEILRQRFLSKSK